MDLTEELILQTREMLDILENDDAKYCLNIPIVTNILLIWINEETELFQDLYWYHLILRVPEKRLEMVLREPIMTFLYHCPDIELQEKLQKLNSPWQINQFYKNTYNTISSFLEDQKFCILQNYLESELLDIFVKEPVLQYKEVVFDKAY